MNGFLDEVVKDERSFHMDNFEKVIRLVEKMKVPIPGDVFDGYLQMVALLRTVNEEGQIKAKLMEDCPDEFIDQVFCVMMETPVKLPSGNLADLNSITRHLMNEPTDPYTRVPLKKEQLVVDEELKAKIDAYVSEKMRVYEVEREERERQKEQSKESHGDEEWVHEGE